jgi:hypothetical protein
MKKTTPENVQEANEALFHATMNLPNAAAHCGMTEREMKMIFREYLKYNAPDIEVVKNPVEIPRRKEQSVKQTVPVPPRPFPGKRIS